MKFPAHRAGLPGKEISFLIVPLDPAYKAGLAGHLPVTSFPQGSFKTELPAYIEPEADIVRAPSEPR